MGSRTETEWPVHLVAGDDEYLIDQKARSVVDALCPAEEQTFGLEIIEGGMDLVDEAVSALSSVIEAVQTVGFYGGRKVVWLRRALFFGEKTRTGKSSEVKNSVESLTRLIKNGLPDGHVLVISAVKVDGRTAFYKACKAGAEITEFKTPDRPKEADQSAMDQAAAAWRNVEMKPGGHGILQEFVNRVGPDTRRLISESEKLSTYLGRDRRTVDENDMAAVVSPGRESITWDLADRVGNRQTGEALKVLRQLLFQGEKPIGLIFGLESRFRDLALFREYMRRNWLRMEGSDRYKKPVWSVDAEGEAYFASLARDPRKGHPYRTVVLLEQATRYTLRELLTAQQELVRTHEKMVSSSLPPGTLLELFILRTTVQ